MGQCCFQGLLIPLHPALHSFSSHAFLLLLQSMCSWLWRFALCCKGICWKSVLPSEERVAKQLGKWRFPSFREPDLPLSAGGQICRPFPDFCLPGNCSLYCACRKLASQGGLASPDILVLCVQGASASCGFAGTWGFRQGSLSMPRIELGGGGASAFKAGF